MNYNLMSRVRNATQVVTVGDEPIHDFRHDNSVGHAVQERMEVQDMVKSELYAATRLADCQATAIHAERRARRTGSDIDIANALAHAGNLTRSWK